MLLIAAVSLVVAVETPRLARLLGAEARKDRDRKRRKAKLRVISPDEESEEFIRSVQADLESLPTIEERDRKT